MRNCSEQNKNNKDDIVDYTKTISEILNCDIIEVRKLLSIVKECTRNNNVVIAGSVARDLVLQNTRNRPTTDNRKPRDLDLVLPYNGISVEQIAYKFSLLKTYAFHEITTKNISWYYTRLTFKVRGRYKKSVEVDIIIDKLLSKTPTKEELEYHALWRNTSSNAFLFTIYSRDEAWISGSYYCPIVNNFIFQEKFPWSGPIYPAWWHLRPQYSLDLFPCFWMPGQENEHNFFSYIIETCKYGSIPDEVIFYINNIFLIAYPNFIKYYLTDELLRIAINYKFHDLFNFYSFCQLTSVAQEFYSRISDINFNDCKNHTMRQFVLNSIESELSHSGRACEVIEQGVTRLSEVVSLFTGMDEINHKRSDRPASRNFRLFKKGNQGTDGVYAKDWQVIKQKKGEVWVDIDLTSEGLLENVASNDRTVVLSAVNVIPAFFKHAKPEFRADREIGMVAVSSSSMLKYTLGNLNSDKELVLAAVKKHGASLKYACKNLSEDPEVVEAAVTQDGSALAFASDLLKNNQSIVKIAVNNYIHALTHISTELIFDDDFYRELLSGKSKEDRKRLHSRIIKIRAERQSRNDVATLFRTVQLS